MTVTTTYTTASVFSTTTVSQPSGTAPGLVTVYSPFPKFNCDANAYLGAQSTFSQVNLTSGTSTLLNSNATGGNGGLNAMVYNPADNYIYAVTQSGATSRLVRISALGTSFLLNTVDLSAYGYASLTGAEIDPLGIYRGFSQSGTTAYIYELDLRPTSANFGSTLSITPTTVGPYNIYDLALVPDANGVRGVYNGKMVSAEQPWTLPSSRMLTCRAVFYRL